MAPTAEPAGESAVLTSVVERFDAFIRRTARKYGVRGADLDEVVQDVRIRLWRAAATGSIRCMNARYIYLTASSVAVDLVRRQRTRTARAISLEDVSPVLLGAAARVEDRLAVSDLAQVIEQSVSRLPSRRQVVVRLRLRGYDRLQIAEMVGWSEPTARNLLSRGLAELRQILQERGVPVDGRRPSSNRVDGGDQLRSKASSPAISLRSQARACSQSL